MLQIFNTVEDGLQELDQVTEGCWVALTKPTMEELETVSATTGIDIDDLRAPLDDEERSRVEIENDYVVILVDIPSLDEKDRYVTIPLGIYTTEKMIVTVCLEETPVLKAFMNNREREFYTFKKTRFVFQILYRNATSYLRYLRIIDRKSEQIEEKLSSYVNRMLAHEPLPYILGQWDFYGISLEVTPDVLIPRDDTMAVTDLALDVLRGREAPRVLDLCCGSGCIGLAIAHQLPDAHVTLADISRPALAVAKRNIKRLKLMNRVTAVGLDARKRGPSFVGTLDALVCNPPYVTSEEMTRLEPSVKEYEPALALDGGKDGLAFYRAVAENFTHLLADGGYLCFEFGLGQHMAVSMILQEYGYTDIVLRKDLRGVVRAVRGKKK